MAASLLSRSRPVYLSHPHQPFQVMHPSFILVSSSTDLDQTQAEARGKLHRSYMSPPTTILAAGEIRPLSRPLQTLLRVHTKILGTVFTNALSVQARSADIRKCGHVKHVGRCFISRVSRNGQQTRALHIINKPIKILSFPPKDSGDVLAAIFRKIPYLLRMHVGARRSLTPDRYRGYRHILAARHVANPEFYLGNAHIRASCSATPGHVHHVLTWDPHKAAFAVRT